VSAEYFIDRHAVILRVIGCGLIGYVPSRVMHEVCLA
jgi:hypothetical protein